MADMKPPPEKGPHQPWTQDELNMLHEMVREYALMQFLKKKAWMWGLWVLGLPATVLYFWEPVVRLWKLFRSG